MQQKSSILQQFLISQYSQCSQYPSSSTAVPRRPCRAATSRSSVPIFTVGVPMLEKVVFEKGLNYLKRVARGSQGA